MRWGVAGGLLMAALAALSLWLASTPAARPDDVQRLQVAAFLPSPSLDPPGPGSGWQPTALPVLKWPAEAGTPRPAWYRMSFRLPREPQVFWGVLLPYLYGGGQVWLGGELLADIPASTPAQHVRWERPHLVAVPAHLLHAGDNELWVHAVPVAGETTLTFPQPWVGPLADLQTAHDRRFFWMHTVPSLTVAACLVISAFVLLIWWRLPEEALYGWFGLASGLWGVRTLTFVMEVLPADRWPLWRLLYLAATGGFVVVMAIFALHLAGMRRRSLERGLLVCWAVGPAWFALQGAQSDALVNWLWTGALVPVGMGAVVVSGLAAWRQRSAASLLLAGALAVATLSGVHDYLLVWKPQWLQRLAPQWAGQRYFLLHHGANLLLLAMGALLSSRFVRTVRSLQQLNQTLESRIADRERSLADNFVRLAQLERQNAAAEERKLIMREIHDGLGSKLFTSLSRVERGAMDGAQMAASLRACISDMRLALDALAPDDHDLTAAFGDFMFRWQAELQAAGVRCEWDIDVDDDDASLAPHATLQLLRVAQEALTNVAKHARATQVALSLRHRHGEVRLCIQDDGIGLAAAASAGGRGLHNMRTRAEHLGGTLAIERTAGAGTRIVLTVPSSREGAMPVPEGGIPR